ncbi:uncharacterized protein L199_000862 [Kwoniella botswanensis]|uniref:uncharacterized protein n=1 Tax=Kwoniella botswanensis TaxID=1268659 RepID=UPI00315D8A3D
MVRASQSIGLNTRRAAESGNESDIVESWAITPPSALPALPGPLIPNYYPNHLKQDVQLKRIYKVSLVERHGGMHIETNSIFGGSHSRVKVHPEWKDQAIPAFNRARHDLHIPADLSSALPY